MGLAHLAMSDEGVERYQEVWSTECGRGMSRGDGQNG